MPPSTPRSPQLRDLQTRESRMIIRAPVAGLVLTRNVRPGDMAGAAPNPDVHASPATAWSSWTRRWPKATWPASRSAMRSR